jgi:hypothetical protein
MLALAGPRQLHKEHFMAKSTVVTPPVGWRVQFFRHGDLSADPLAADVVEAGMEGCVKLNVHFPGGGESVSSGEYVHFCGSEWVEKNGHKLKAARGNCPRGVWNWMPGFRYIPDGNEAATKKKGLQRVPLPPQSKKEEKEAVTA